jgi:glutamyl/glutaminyl-tRNA synthetase
LDDFVIVRSNGWPTFHLANVVDDWKMGITHVMRGEEWLTNTNKHIYLYMLLGAPIPKFVHLPLIKDMNGKKLAKRDPSSAVKFFQTGKYEV